MSGDDVDFSGDDDDGEATEDPDKLVSFSSSNLRGFVGSDLERRESIPKESGDVDLTISIFQLNPLNLRRNHIVSEPIRAFEVVSCLTSRPPIPEPEMTLMANDRGLS